MGTPDLVRVDLPRRTLYLCGDVDERMACKAAVALDRLDATQGTIFVHLNSTGGGEEDGYAIYDALTLCKNEVVAVGYGSVLSIAAVIFQAADERRLAPHASFMIHNGHVTCDEKMLQDAVLDLARQIKKDNKRYYRILAKASGLPLEKIKEYCDSETYFTPHEAVRSGFADVVLRPTKRSK